MTDPAGSESVPTPTAGAPVAVDATPTAYLQLTQTRVPLEDAGEAFTVPDASGRLPIVVLPEQPFRIRNEFVIIGALLIVAGVLFEVQVALRGGLLGIGALLVFLGVFQSFMVAVPEGARALLLKSGRYYRTVGAGRHVVPPWIVVSHVVTVREIPFNALVAEAPTSDDVRIDFELLLTFTIGAPERFVFAISAPDFDQVCQAACHDAIRLLVRSKSSDDIMDLTAEDTDRLKGDIGEAMGAYGAEIQRVVVTHVQPPRAFLASRESRKLAAVQRDEQGDRHALEERLLADREALERQRITAQRERIELEAANEDLRLRHLQARLAAYPQAARRDLDDQRLAVARALAGNSRAMVQVGSGGDVAEALIVRSLSDEPADGASAPTKATTSKPKAGA